MLIQSFSCFYHFKVADTNFLLFSSFKGCCLENFLVFIILRMLILSFSCFDHFKVVNTVHHLKAVDTKLIKSFSCFHHFKAVDTKFYLVFIILEWPVVHFKGVDTKFLLFSSFKGC